MMDELPGTAPQTGGSSASVSVVLPLEHYQLHGIEHGLQWHVLGQLAARHARDFSKDELAGQLMAVMDACHQDGWEPWTRWHAAYIASRAKRFIDGEDAKALETFA
jgi:hypothetical protein